MRNAKIKIIKPVPNKNHCAYRHFWAHFSNMVMKGNYFEVSTYVQKKPKKKKQQEQKKLLKTCQFSPFTVLSRIICELCKDLR